MKTPFRNNLMRSNSAFTLIELMIVVGIMGILSAIVIPNLLKNRPERRMQKAARELMGDIQKTRAMAIKTNKEWAIVFVPDINRNGTPRNGALLVEDSYFITSSRGNDGVWSTIDADGSQPVQKRVSFVVYDKYIGDGAHFATGIMYGHGSATKNAQYAGGTLPTDGVSFPANILSFNSKGICSGALTGYGYRFVYFQYRLLPNPPFEKAYAVGTGSTGVVKIARWDGGDWKW